jgi:hypothetical protein
MVDSQPELAQVIRRVRGGYLKIQGTWMPYEVSIFTRIHHIILPIFLMQIALRLARRLVFL